MAVFCHLNEVVKSARKVPAIEAVSKIIGSKQDWMYVTAVPNDAEIPDVIVPVYTSTLIADLVDMDLAYYELTRSSVIAEHLTQLLGTHQIQQYCDSKPLFGWCGKLGSTKLAMTIIQVIPLHTSAYEMILIGLPRWNSDECKTLVTYLTRAKLRMTPVILAKFMTSKATEDFTLHLITSAIQLAIPDTVGEMRAGHVVGIALYYKPNLLPYLKTKIDANTVISFASLYSSETTMLEAYTRIRPWIKRVPEKAWSLIADKKYYKVADFFLNKCCSLPSAELLAKNLELRKRLKV